jgi:sulfatase maturation enzyme AslB (radical SAM superfamily)
MAKAPYPSFSDGADGVDVVNDQHRISVLFTGSGASISIVKGRRKLTKSAMFNTFAFNTRSYNQHTSVQITSTAYEFATLFKQAFDSGLLHMPFYQPVSVTIVG